MKMMRLAEISEQDENHRSPLDDMMDELRTENPHSMAVSFYADFKKAPAETAKSILISAAVRFAAFNLPEVADLTHTDNIHLDTLGDRKTALFIIIPSSDATFNFLAAMMYTQLFDTLYDTANSSTAAGFPSMCGVCSTSLQMSALFRILINCLQQCVAWKYPQTS